MRGMCTIALQEDRTIEIDHVAQLLEHERGRHGEGGSHHVAHHELQPQLTGPMRHRQRFRETTTLVELDVHHVETPGREATSARP